MRTLTEVYRYEHTCGDLVHEIVTVVKQNLKVDCAKPHRESVEAAVISVVKMVLRKRKVRKEDFDFNLQRVMDQATALYEAWPMRV
jgi:hypothetical protein